MQVRKHFLQSFSLPLFLVALIAVSLPAAAQTAAPNEWTWMGGSSTFPCSDDCGQPGVYGTLGVPAAANIPGGRESGASWTDSSGNFWLFGGLGFDSKVAPTNQPDANAIELNDLWEFNFSNQEWTWMGGSDLVNCGTTGWQCVQPGVYGALGEPAAGNIPGGRYFAASWVDNRGNLWLFGGEGFDSNGNNGFLNDLWEFNPSTNEWTWWSGSSNVSCTSGPCGLSGVYGTLGKPAAGNVPGSRAGAAAWTDNSGSLWLFGGWGFDTSGNDGSLNDLWEFNPSTNEWAWMGGSSTVPKTSNGTGGQPGVYGTQGTPAPGNIPGGRQGANGWTDSSGNLWLFGGSSISGNNTGYLNDLWEFSPAIGEWTWMCGSDLPGDTGLSAEPCSDSASSASANGFVPAARWQATSWTDGAGQLWLFGGIGQPSGVGVELNDIWVFNPSLRKWTWKDGSGVNSTVAGGIYGTLGSPSPGNIPGFRSSSSAWIDASDNLWLFGGFGEGAQINSYTEVAYTGYLNDLWMFSPTGQSLPRVAAPKFSVTAGVYPEPQSVTIADSTTGATVYYTADGTTPTTSSAQYSGAITVSSTETLKAIATASGYSRSTVAAAAYTITPPAATPTFSVAAGTYTSTQTVTISDATSGAIIYYTTNGATPTTSSTQYTGAITVAATETIQAIAVASGYSSSAVATATYTINLPPPDFAVAATPASQTVTGGQSVTATVSVTPANGFNSSVSFACSGLPSGAACSFSPTTVTPPGTTSTTVTVSTTTADAALHLNPRPLIPVAALAALLCCFGFRKRRRLVLVLLVMSAAGLALLSGCGGGSGSGGGGGGSQSANYTITVNATSGSLAHSTTISLTVN
jgi:N-acetylneuraminic acid mutarotase